MKQWPSVITAVAFASAPASAGAPSFAGQAAVSDSELAGTMGGFSTPVGIDVNFAVEINTRIDGQLALRSVLKPGIDPVTVYVPPIAPPQVDVPPTIISPVNIAPVDVGPVNVPQVNIDPVSVPAVNVPPVIIPVISVPPINVGPTPAPPVTPAIPAGPAAPAPIIGPAFTLPAIQQVLPAVNVTVGAIGAISADAGDAAGAHSVLLPTAGATAAPIESVFGNVTVEASRTGPKVVLTGPDIDIRHMLGQATTIIANIANDRIIDTTTIVHLDLPNVQGLALSSALSRIEDAIRRD